MTARVREWSASGPFERRPTARPERVHLRSRHADVYLDGVAADAWSALPASFARVRIERDPGSGATTAILADDREWRVAARAARIHEARPELYAAPLARFAPTPAEERTIRWLLRLLRIPGTTRLIRAWQAWRTR